jgi:thiol-disulfide isomerase/thioredoxin
MEQGGGHNDRADWKKYLIVFAITSFVFFLALYLSNYFNDRRLSALKSITDKIAIDILSSETQFALLAESSCQGIDNSILSQELSSLADRLSYAEENMGAKNAEVVRLKKYYSLLEVKDFLLVKKMGERCGSKPTAILYFYSNEGDCPDCRKAGLVLTGLREKYPDLRTYSFDYNLDSPVIKTLISLYGIKNDLPAMVIKEKARYGFKDQKDIESLLPELKNLEKRKLAPAKKENSE